MKDPRTARERREDLAWDTPEQSPMPLAWAGLICMLLLVGWAIW